jgi:hypothetical protein
MGKHRGKQKEKSDSKGAVPRALVFLHDDVVQLLRDWGKTKEHSSMAVKVRNLVNAFLDDNRQTVNAIKRQLAVDPIHGCPGLQELGPKQSKVKEVPQEYFF